MTLNDFPLIELNLEGTGNTRNAPQDLYVIIQFL